ncbi:phosphatase PAP2 family protein [Euzebya rosea]|uniref:phosphatase PAP2 family protein n=1 Tax=Euzebya rosea TaxID=2052804 RepID=UPI0014768096|nr:phosphatase PAP2 family protein [Euzebya rosea]
MTTRSGAMTQARRRHGSDVVRVVLGLATLVLASLPVRPDSIGRVETGAFDLVNGLPDHLYPVLWGPMQLGSLVAVPLVVGAALITRRRGLALEAAVAGTTAWTLAKVVKDAYGRPRPGGLLEEVAFRGGEPVGFGFVSGHTSVAFALATAATLYVPRRWRGRLFAIAALVGLSRMFVGAHLPLDVVGGAGMGWAIAAAVRLVLGAPTGRPSVDRVRTGLAGLGITAAAIEPVDVPAATSAVYRVTGTDHGDLFAKVVGDRPQDRDLLYRWWLRLRGVPRGAQRFASPNLQVEFEATRTLAAAAAGVAVPEVRYAGPLDPEHAVLLTGWVDGTPIDRLEAVDPATVTELQRQVERLHAAGLSHGDLVGANVLAHRHGVTLVDFGDAAMLASDATLAADRTQADRLLDDVASRR